MVVIIYKSWINKLDNLCRKCRNEREISSEEYVIKEGERYYSDIVLGFGSKELINYEDSDDVDIFLILETYGGGESWNWHQDDLDDRWIQFSDGERSMEQCASDLKRYYLEKNIDSYHQKIIRDLISEIQTDYTYFVSDLVKCYIDKEDNYNIDKASEHCGDLLKQQIEDLSPNLLVSFGTHAKKFIGQQYQSIPRTHQNFKDMNGLRISNLDNEDFKLIIYPFPSASNADLFEKFGGLYGYRYDGNEQKGLVKLIQEELG